MIWMRWNLRSLRRSAGVKSEVLRQVHSWAAMTIDLPLCGLLNLSTRLCIVFDNNTLDSICTWAISAYPSQPYLCLIRLETWPTLNQYPLLVLRPARLLTQSPIRTVATTVKSFHRHLRHHLSCRLQWLQHHPALVAPSCLKSSALHWYDHTLYLDWFIYVQWSIILHDLYRIPPCLHAQLTLVLCTSDAGMSPVILTRQRWIRSR